MQGATRGARAGVDMQGLEAAIAAGSGNIAEVLAILEPVAVGLGEAFSLTEPLLEQTVGASMRSAGRVLGLRVSASKLGIPFKGGTPEYHAAYNALKKKGGVGAAPVGPAAEPGVSLPQPSSDPRAQLDSSDMKKVGGQAGSNPGGLYEAPDGTRYYMKVGKSEDHVRNEVVAGKLYEELGVRVPQTSVATVEGRMGVASKIVSKEAVGPDALASLPGTAEGFVADAFLANWDVVGLGFDNLSSSKGRAMRLDAGGALLYRAQGASKGGAFGPKVTELDTFRNANINPQAARIFGAVTQSQINAGIDKVLGISDARLREIIKLHGPRGNKGDALADLLIARKADLKSRRGPTGLASSLGIPFKGGTPEYRKAYNELKRKGKLGTAPVAEPPTATPVAKKAPVDTDIPGAGLWDEKPDAHSGEPNVPVGMTATQKAVLRGYQNSASQTNTLLREHSGDLDAVDKKKFNQDKNWAHFGHTNLQYGDRVRVMDETFAAVPPLAAKMSVRRGVADHFGERLQPGTSFVDHGFTSTTTNSGAGFGTTVLTIRIPKGARVIDVNRTLGKDSIHKDEAEILLPRGGKYKVLSRKTTEHQNPKKGKYTKTHVEVEYIP